MERTTAQLPTALLEWVNTFALPYDYSRIESHNELRDGRVLWGILRQIDPNHFTSSLPESDIKTRDKWVPRRQNLRHVYRAVTAYIRDVCGQLTHLMDSVQVDLETIARDGSTQESTRLLTLVIFAALCSPYSNQHQVEVLEQLGQAVGAPIAQAIKRLEGEDQKQAQNADKHDVASDDNVTDTDASSRTTTRRDTELELEAQLIDVTKENKHLEVRVEILTRDIEQRRLQISDLEEQLVDSRLALDRTGEQTADPELEQLRQEALRDKDYIAKIEDECEQAKVKLDNQERRIERLQNDAATKQELRDELQEVKTEREELKQKAKANDNLIKKIQSLQDQERANQRLQEDLQIAREQLQELETLRENYTGLRKANEESAIAIANCEQEIFDQKTTRTRLEHEVKLLNGNFQQAQDLYNREQEFNAELQSKVRELETVQSSGAGGLGSLEDELVGAEKESEMQVLRFENRQLRKLMRRRNRPKPPPAVYAPPNQENLSLKQRLEISETRLAKLETKYLDVYQENLAFQSSIGDSAGPRSDHPFVRQREKLHGLESELAELKAKCFETGKENSALNHRATTAESMLKEQASSEVEQMRRTLAAEFEGLNSNHADFVKRYEELQAHSRALEGEVEDQKSLLRHAILSRDNLRIDDGEALLANELRIIRQQLKIVRATPEPETSAVIDETAKGIAGMIAEGRTLGAVTEKRAAEQDQLIQSLRRDLEKAERGASQSAMNAAAQHEIVTLKRENKLMATAWYDLQTRIQNNNVALQRRADVPKSWLGRQRVAVGQPGSGPFRR